MPGFTHLKNAQAVSFAHYLMAYVEMFDRVAKVYGERFVLFLLNPYLYSKKKRFEVGWQLKG